MNIMNVFGQMRGLIGTVGKGTPRISKFLDIKQEALALRANVHKAYVKTLTDKGIDMSPQTWADGSVRPSDGMDALRSYEKGIMYELGGAKGVERLQRMVGPSFQNKFDSMLGLQLDDIRNIPDAALKGDSTGMLQGLLGQHKEQIRGWGDELLQTAYDPISKTKRPGKINEAGDFVSTKINNIDIKDWEHFRRLNRNDSIRYHKADILDRAKKQGYSEGQDLPVGFHEEWEDLPPMDFLIGEKIRNIDLPYYNPSMSSKVIFTHPVTGSKYSVNLDNGGKKGYSATTKLDSAYIDPKTNEIVEWPPGPGKNPREVTGIDNNGAPIYGNKIPGISKKDVFSPHSSGPMRISQEHLMGVQKQGLKTKGVGQRPESQMIHGNVHPLDDMSQWTADTEFEIIKNILNKHGIPESMGRPPISSSNTPDPESVITWFKTSQEMSNLPPNKLKAMHDEYVKLLTKAVKSRSSAESTNMMNISKSFELGAISTSDSMSSNSLFAYATLAEREGAKGVKLYDDIEKYSLLNRAHNKRSQIRGKGGIPGELTVYDDTFQEVNSITRSHASGPIDYYGLDEFKKGGGINLIEPNTTKGTLSFSIELDPLHYYNQKKVLNASDDIANLPTFDKGTRRIVVNGLYEGVGLQGVKRPRKAVKEAVEQLSESLSKTVDPKELLERAEKIGRKTRVLRTKTDVAMAVKEYLINVPTAELKKIIGNNTPVQYVQKVLGPAIKRSETELRRGFGGDFKLVFKIDKPYAGRDYMNIEVYHSKVEAVSSLTKATINKKVLGALPVLEGVRWEYKGQEK